jgi:MFS family permease
VKATFRSLHGFNYRVWASGTFVSNIGTWMQRIAQDWLVLTQLSHNNATALGVVIALQFAPQALLLPVTGFAADHFDRRKLLIATQASMGLLALGLGILTVAGHVAIWHVWVFAFLLGCVTAFDAPARQTFVAELVGEADLPNAVGLNSASFNLARMVGPAVAGILIGAVGSGIVFLINAASFAAVIGSLLLLRVDALARGSRVERKLGSLAEGFRYVWKRPDLKAILLMVFLIGTFGLNFSLFISTMSVKVFHVGAGPYGVLTSLMALGSIAGALLAAGRAKPSVALLFGAAAVLAGGFALAAVMPSYWLFGAALVIVGISAQTVSTTTLSTVQLATEPAMRGRVMAILLAIFMGGTPIGAPILGWVADKFGARWSLGVAAVTALAASAVGLYYFAKRTPMSTYGLTEFTAEIHAIVKDEGQAGLPRVAEKLKQLLANPAFVAETFDDAMPPGKRVLHHDPHTDVYVLAHVHRPSPKPGLPHSHGTSWAVYGNAKGATEMTIWQRINQETEDHAELKVADKYVLGEGEARCYSSGAIHSTNQPGHAWVIRVTGTDLDVLPRYRFNRATDKMVDVTEVTV